MDYFDIPILSFSKSDHVSWRTACEGWLITGAPGSGKSSCTAKSIAYAKLKTPNSGGLVLTAKAEETRNWIAYAKACGREKDLIVFNADSGLSFDPFHYEWTRPGRGSGLLESLIDLFSTLLNIGKPEGREGHDPFWSRGAESLMRAAIKLLDLAGERISIVNIDSVIRSLPSIPGQEDDPAWQSTSFTKRCVTAIEARYEKLSEYQKNDLEFCVNFLFRRWPAFDERPRSSLEMTWAGMADKFLYDPFNRLFCSGRCDFSPEDTTERGKIVVCDFPLLEYGHEAGKLIQIITKLIFQRAWLRRDLNKSSNPCFLFQDEFQYFIVPKYDNYFQQTCRGSRISVVCITQNILNLSEALFEDSPGSKTKSFCGNLAIKIAHQQNEPDTTKFMADIIGKEYRYLDSFNASGESRSQASVGGTKHLAHILEPIEFSKLLKPDGTNPYAAAIVYLGGKTFNANNRNYLPVYFSRE